MAWAFLGRVEAGGQYTLNGDGSIFRRRLGKIDPSPFSHRCGEEFELRRFLRATFERPHALRPRVDAVMHTVSLADIARDGLEDVEVRADGAVRIPGARV